MWHYKNLVIRSFDVVDVLKLPLISQEPAPVIRQIGRRYKIWGGIGKKRHPK